MMNWPVAAHEKRKHHRRVTVRLSESPSYGAPRCAIPIGSVRDVFEFTERHLETAIPV